MEMALSLLDIQFRGVMRTTDEVFPLSQSILLLCYVSFNHVEKFYSIIHSSEEFSPCGIPVNW